jgi:hypothetical protein
MALSKRGRVITLSLILIICISAALVGAFERQIVEYFIPTKGWVQFNVPQHAREIRASVQRSNADLKICNQDEVDWTSITVKITGIYNAPYLARPKPIRAGRCEYVPFSKFAEPSWKRMPMPPNEKPVTVELLVDYEDKGYASVQPK